MKKTFRSRPLDLAVDTISVDDLEDLISWLQSYPRLTMGNETRRFEEKWASWLGTEYAVYCNSGSSANLLMYAALEEAGLAGNKKVVVPATGWVTTVAPAIQLGFQPIMCESDPDTFGLDINALEVILKRENPAAVIMVHVLGVPNNMGPILDLQKQYGFQLMEDCCASHGARHKGRQVGTFGQLSSFSFYYGHHMSTIEGGVVCTDDERLYFKLLMLRSHGWCKDLPKREYDRLMDKYGIDASHSPFSFILSGYNLRATDLTAHIGCRQLDALDGTVEKRIRNHLQYQQRMQGKLRFAHCLEGDVISSISFCALAESVDQRDAIVNMLNENEIDTRLFTAGNLGRHPFWAEKYGAFSAPVADRLYETGFFLPNTQSLTSDNIDFICDKVIEAI